MEPPLQQCSSHRSSICGRFCNLISYSFAVSDREPEVDPKLSSLDGGGVLASLLDRNVVQEYTPQTLGDMPSLPRTALLRGEEVGTAMCKQREKHREAKFRAFRACSKAPGLVR